MKQTEKLKLNLIEPQDPVNRDPFNQNAQILEDFSKTLLTPETAKKLGLNPQTATVDQALAKEIAERKKVQQNIKFQQAFYQYQSSGYVDEYARCTFQVPLAQLANKYSVLIIRTKIQGTIEVSHMHTMGFYGLNQIWFDYASCLNCGYQTNIYHTEDTTITVNPTFTNVSVIFPMSNSSNPIFGFNPLNSHSDADMVLPSIWGEADNSRKYGGSPIRVDFTVSCERNVMKGKQVSGDITIYAL